MHQIKNYIEERNTLPKSFLVLYSCTLGGGILAEAILLGISFSSSRQFASLPPLVFLITFALWALVFILLLFFKKDLARSLLTLFVAPRSPFKDLLAFLWEQGVVFLFLWGLVEQSPKLGGQSGDPYALAFLFAAILLGLLALYPLFWGMEEREENSPMLFEKTSQSTLIAYRILTLLVSLAFSAFLMVLLILNFDGATLGEKVALFGGSIFFFAVAIAGLILLKKERFERGFAFFVYESSRAKDTFLILIALPFALSLYAPFLFSTTITWAILLPYVPLYIFDGLFVLFGILPLLFLRYPYSKACTK